MPGVTAAATAEPVTARVVAVRAADPTPAEASRVHIVNHPAAQHALTVLCRRQTEAYEFRTTCNQLLVLLTLEAMRSLPTREQEVETTRAPWLGVALAKPVVLLAVTRNSIGLSHNLMDCVAGLLVGSISLGQFAEGLPPLARLHLASAPALNGCRVILFDPVIKSGVSAEAALGLVRELGAADVSLVGFTISSQALLRLQATVPTLSIWTAHVETDWDPARSQSGMLGDFGTRLFA